MAVSYCNSCGRYLGYIIQGDVHCQKCGTINLVRDGKLEGMTVKELYTMGTARKTG